MKNIYLLSITTKPIRWVIFNFIQQTQQKTFCQIIEYFKSFFSGTSVVSQLFPTKGSYWQRRIQRVGCLGRLPPPKTYESNFIHHVFCNSESSIRNIKPFCRPLFCYNSVARCTSSLFTEAKPLSDLTTKYYWNRSTTKPYWWSSPAYWWSSPAYLPLHTSPAYWWSSPANLPLHTSPAYWWSSPAYWRFRPLTFLLNASTASTTKKHLQWIEKNQFSWFMHPDQAQNTSSGIQGQEATAVAVIYVTAPTEKSNNVITKNYPASRKHAFNLW